MPSTSTRRSVLAALSATVATAGCLGDTDDGTPTTSPRTARTPTDIRTESETDQPGTCCYHVITLRARRVDRAAVADGWSVAVERLDPTAQAVARDALGGETTVEAWEGPPLDAGAYLVADGRYYRVEETVVDERPATAYQFEAEVPARDDPGGDPLAYADLTPEERRVVDAAVEGYAPDDSGYLRSFPVVFLDGDADDCRFLDGQPRFVAHEDAVVRLRFEESTETTAETYRYRCPEVAADASAFASLVVDSHVARPADADLRESQREVARELFAAGRFESDNPASEAVTALAYWLREFTSPVSGDVFAAWDGTLYEVEIEEVVS